MLGSQRDPYMRKKTIRQTLVLFKLVASLSLNAGVIMAVMQCHGGVARGPGAP